MLGRGSSLVDECLNGGFIGAHFGFKQDLTDELTDDKHKFIDRLAPEWMERAPEKSRRSAGQAVGFLWRVIIGINEGDTILSPDGQGAYTVGTVTEPYSYHKDQPLPHRRSVKWTDRKIGRNEMSESLRNALGTPGTVGYVTKHAEEIESLIQGKPFNQSKETEESGELTSERQFDEALNVYMTKKMDHICDQLEDNRLKDILTQINQLKLNHPEVTLNLARKATELMCKNLNKEIHKKDLGDQTLDKLIISIRADVPRLALAHLYAIMHYGNFGSHDMGEGNYALRTECITPCIMAYVSLLEWYIYAGYA